MKIEQLSFDKVHVRLSIEDLKNMDMTPEKFLTDSSTMNGFIMNILHEIYETTDFNPFSGSITMEAMPDDDGMSIMLTKGARPGIMPPDPQEAVRRIAHILGLDDKNTLTKPKIRSVKAVRDDAVKGCRVFFFDDFDDLCMALSRTEEGTLCEGELYRLDGDYALIIPIMTKTLDDVALLMEFSARMSAGLNYLHVREHGKKVAEKASLAAMAQGIKKLHKI